MLRLNKDIVVNDIKRVPFNRNKTYFPEAGMLGTEYVGSDRYAVVCISVDSPKRITVGKLSNVDENTDIDNYPNIEIDDEGVMRLININAERIYTTSRWSLRTDKRGNQGWREMGSGKHSASIHWGIADPYRDPSF